MIPKFISKDGSVLQIDITKIPIETLLTIISTRSERRVEDGAIQTTISLDALKIMETYAIEGKLLLCSSILDMVTSSSSWNVSDELIGEVGIILVTNVAEYSSAALMRIVFEELWAVHNKIYANVIHEYTYFELKEIRERYRVINNGIMISGADWISSRYKSYMGGGFFSAIQINDAFSYEELYPSRFVKFYPEKHMVVVGPGVMGNYLYAKSYEDGLFIIQQYARIIAPMRPTLTLSSIKQSNQINPDVTENIPPPLIKQFENVDAPVNFVTEFAPLEEILLNDNIPYLYRSYQPLSKDKLILTSSWLFCAIRGLNVVNNKMLARSELYNYMMYPLYMSGFEDFIHVHIYSNTPINIQKPHLRDFKLVPNEIRDNINSYRNL